MQITQPNIQSPAVSHCRTKASMRLRVRALIRREADFRLLRLLDDAASNACAGVP